MMELLCLILLFGWMTPGQTNVPVVVKEDSDAVLPCSPSTKENIETKLFDWKKDRQEVFFYSGGEYYGHSLSGQDKQFEGRVSHFNDELKNGNASIKISETKVSDSGNYTCKFPRLQPPQEFLIELVVEPVFKDRSGENPTASPKPYIESLNQTQDWALLQCEVLGASPEPELEWRDSSGNILPAEETQRSITGGKYDLTIQANVTERGEYFCVLKQEKIHHEVTAKTFVFISAASPEPYTRILHQTQDWTLLQCEVLGASPEPKLEWRDSSGNILHAEETQRSITGGKYDLTIQAKVTERGEYFCVLKQEKIHHEVTAKTFVFISAASPKPYTRILPQTQDWALLQCEVRGASPEPKLEWRDSSGHILPAEETQRSFTGGKYDLTIQAKVTERGNYLCVLKQEGIHHEVTAKTFVFISEKVCEDPSVKVLIGWFGGLTVGLAVGVIFLAAVLTLPLRWIPSFRYRVIDFLSRLKPRREQDMMDPDKREHDGVPEYHDEDESGSCGSSQDSGIPLRSLNGSTI